MKRIILTFGILALTAAAQERAIDSAKSIMTIHVSKAGALSAFGHNHEISAPIRAGKADVSGKKVELTVDASTMKVVDPGASEKDRGEIQQGMMGPDVLDAEKFHEIIFRSTSATQAGSGAWTIRGPLTLRGQTKDVTVTVTEKGGHFIGQSVMKLSDFGITPKKVAGGAIKVKDEIRIDFDIQLAR